MSLKDKLQAFPEAFATEIASVVHDAIQTAAEALTADFIEAVSGSTFEEFMALTNGDSGSKRGGKKGSRSKKKSAKKARKSKASGRRAASKGGRLPRRSAEEIEKVIHGVVKVLRRNPKGMRSEQIREKLGLDAREIPRVLKMGVASGAVRVLSGQKRSTTYGAGRGKAKAVKAKKSKPRKSAKKK